MGLLGLCVLALSVRPLPWRRRSGGLARRPRYVCVLELRYVGLMNNLAGMCTSLVLRGFCGILGTLSKTMPFVCLPLKGKVAMRQEATLKVLILHLNKSILKLFDHFLVSRRLQAAAETHG